MFLTVVLILSAQSARAETLAEKKKFKTAVELVDEELVVIERNCHVKMTFAMDQSTFGDWTDGMDLGKTCGHVVGTVASMCSENPASAQAIKNQIASFRCVGRGTDESESYELRNKTLKYAVAKDGYNSNAREWLKRNLKVGEGGSYDQNHDYEISVKNIKETLKNTNSVCSSHIELDLDKASLLKVGADDPLAHFCQHPVELLQKICSEADTKGAFEKVKRVRCTRADKPENQFESFSKGTLTYTLGHSRSTDTTKDLNWLKENLK